MLKSVFHCELKDSIFLIKALQPYGRYSCNNLKFIYMLNCFSYVQLFATPVDLSLPDCSVHGVFPAKILEWVVMPSSWQSSQLRD